MTCLGCVLANRLTENPEWKVLLIEAGGQDDYKSDTPFLAEFLIHTEKDWNMTSVPQARACRGNIVISFINFKFVVFSVLSIIFEVFYNVKTVVYVKLFNAIV